MRKSSAHISICRSRFLVSNEMNDPLISFENKMCIHTASDFVFNMRVFRSRLSSSLAVFFSFIFAFCFVYYFMVFVHLFMPPYQPNILYYVMISSLTGKVNYYYFLCIFIFAIESTVIKMCASIVEGMK